MEKLPTNIPGFVIDEDSGVITNMNLNELELYRIQVAAALEQQQLKEKVDVLEKLIGDLLNRNKEEIR